MCCQLDNLSACWTIQEESRYFYVFTIFSVLLYHTIKKKKYYTKFKTHFDKYTEMVTETLKKYNTQDI